MLIRGAVIGTGKIYRDGQEQRLIWARKDGLEALSDDDDVIKEGDELRLVITLVIDGDAYWARLRTRSGERHVYIGPEVRDYRGRLRSLGDVLRHLAINDPIDLEVDGKNITVQPPAY